MQKTLLIFHLILFAIVNAQNNDPNYVLEHITTSQGLPHDYVTSIISDDHNVKWMGTENGLAKYNGYNFENIKPGKSYKKLKNENIEVLFKDKSNILWIGTKSGGISSLDVRNNTIINYNHLLKIGKNAAINITAIAADSVGNIWIGTWEDGVFVINPNKNILIKHIKINSTIYSIIKDNDANMWISRYKTLSKHNLSGTSIAQYNTNQSITDLILDTKRNKIWIGTSNGNTKLYYFDFKLKS